MIPVLEAVPNFSEGRDPGFVRDLVSTVQAAGVEVLDVSSDADHHRSVLTFIGPPAEVEDAAVAAALFARDHIDLRKHRGVHPRIGATDVLPFVPLHDLNMDDAVVSARRVGERLGAEGVPTYLYGAASSPPGRRLADLRRGGFEALSGGFPSGREPDFPGSSDSTAPHPTAGVTAVGAREILLAWNVFVEGVALADVRAIAASIREVGGGFPCLRALGLELEGSERLQVSMNLEDPERTPPLDVFLEIEREVVSRGGRVVETEVIGMIPDALVFGETRNRLKLLEAPESRFLSDRVREHVEVRRRLAGSSDSSPPVGDSG